MEAPNRKTPHQSGNRAGQLQKTTAKEYLFSTPRSMSKVAGVPAMSDDNLLVRFTQLTNAEGLLTKTIQPDGSDGIVKTPAAHMYRGVAEEVEIPFAELGEYLRSLSQNQAIAHGLTGHRRVNVVSTEGYAGQPGTITRTKEFFSYSQGPGLGLFDHDPKPGQPALTPDEFINVICEVWPGFAELPTVCTPSTSACIYDLDGNQLTGPGAGFHLYFLCPRANRLPELADLLFKRLWLLGRGYIFLSKIGAMLPRTVFDKTVFSPERLDFVAGANCINCEQRLPDPVYRPGRLEVMAWA